MESQEWAFPVSQKTVDDTLVKPFVGGLWVALAFTLFEDLPKNVRRALLVALVIGGTLYLDRRNRTAAE